MDLKGIGKELRESTVELFSRPQKQVAALDGLRTMAILLVVGLHCATHISRAGLETSFLYRLPPFQGGWVGVPLFFVLSGFFIGGQLWKEFTKTGTVSIGRFILRRGLRIWPLYYFMLFAIAIIFPEKCKDIWSNVLFLANYLGDEGPIRGAWSLSTEEQFYIIIPTVIFVFARYFGFRHLSDYRKLLIAALFLPMVSRALTWYYWTGFAFFDIGLYQHKIYRPIHTHFDGLIVGLLISNLLADSTINKNLMVKHSWKFIISTCVVLVGLTFWQKVVFNYSALAACFGFAVWYAINRKDVITRLLSWYPLYWTAKVSFGVYLVHHPVLWTMEKFGWFSQVLINPEAYLLMTYVFTFLTSCIISSFTFVFIEAPFIRWRNGLLKGAPQVPITVGLSKTG